MLSETILNLTGKAYPNIMNEFVDFNDLRVATIREMMDLGVPHHSAKTIKEVLSAIWKDFHTMDEPITRDYLESLTKSTSLTLKDIPNAH